MKPQIAVIAWYSKETQVFLAYNLVLIMIRSAFLAYN